MVSSAVSRLNTTIGPKGMTTRRRLLDSLREILDVEPLHHITIQRVAWNANVSPATFFCYFENIDMAIIALVPKEWSTHEKAPMWETQVRHTIAMLHLANLHGGGNNKRKGGSL